jgi:hypothetical protein
MLLFAKEARNTVSGKRLIYGHIVLLLLLLIDLFLIITFKSSFRSVWVDRLIVIGFLVTGVVIFVRYRKWLRWWGKVYFGFFLMYPLVAALSFLIDRIFFVLLTGPLVTTFLLPEIYFSDATYEIRKQGGMMASQKLILIKKDWFTETEVGRAEEELDRINCQNFKIVANSDTSIVTSVQQNGNSKVLNFWK